MSPFEVTAEGVCIILVMHDIKCQYCGKKTGSTPYKWATEDICDGCAKPIIEAYESQAECQVKPPENLTHRPPGSVTG